MANGTRDGHARAGGRRLRRVGEDRRGAPDDRPQWSRPLFLPAGAALHRQPRFSRSSIVACFSSDSSRSQHKQLAVLPHVQGMPAPRWKAHGSDTQPINQQAATGLMGVCVRSWSVGTDHSQSLAESLRRDRWRRAPYRARLTALEFEHTARNGHHAVPSLSRSRLLRRALPLRSVSSDHQ